MSISTGTVASPDVSTDLLAEREKGEHAYKEFEQRMQKGDCFHDPIKKIKFKTFTTMKSKPAKGKTKEIVVKADRRLFGNMVLIAQSRKLEMRDVLSHPLGPLPWALSNGDGTMKKTNKAVLSKHLESKVLPVEEVPHPNATIIFAMALMNKLQGDIRTFSELSDHVFSQMFHAGHGSDRIDVVFDVYHSDSIKSAERIQRGSTEGIAFSNIMPCHKIKNWRRLLSCTKSKNKLTAFLAESWKEQKFREKLGRKCMFVTSSHTCIKLTESGWQEIDDLQSTQEEADTCILLHAKHAAETIPALICITEDTDVFIICLGLCQNGNNNIFFRRGSKLSVRLVDITKLAAPLGRDVCTALLGLHPWTGCDTISAFAGQGKLKALKIILREQKFIDAFATLGSSWNVANQLFCIIEECVCQLYCRNTKILKVNELRYQMFSSRRGEMESAELPPCEDTLKQHILRANYKAAIW